MRMILPFALLCLFVAFADCLVAGDKELDEEFTTQYTSIEDILKQEKPTAKEYEECIRKIEGIFSTYKVPEKYEANLLLYLGHSYYETFQPDKAAQHLEQSLAKGLAGKVAHTARRQWINALFMLGDGAAVTKALEKVEQGLSESDKAEWKPWIERRRKTCQWLGKQAPDVAFKHLADGKEFSLKDRGEKILVLHFWASWCEQCKKDLPRLRALFDEYKSSKIVEFTGVSLDTVKDHALQFIESRELGEKPEWPQSWEENDFKGSVAAAFGVEFVPLVLIIDAKGVIRYCDFPSDNPVAHTLKYVFEQK